MLLPLVAVVAWLLPTPEENDLSVQLSPASRLVLAHPHLEQLHAHPLMVGLAVAQLDRNGILRYPDGVETGRSIR